MTPETIQRLFGAGDAFADPVTRGIVIAVAAALGGAWLTIQGLRRANKLSDGQYDELNKRMNSWFVLAPAIVVPILLGAAWTIAGAALLSVLCYREFARATGLFRQPGTSALVAAGIGAITFAVADHWYGLFVALPSLGVMAIASAGILSDKPKGYIQRVALGALGFLLFGVALGHLGYMANDPNFRPIMLLLVLAIELNDVFAYLAGKAMGKRKLAPNTSPNKTIGGALGALIGTTALVSTLGHFVFAGSSIDTPLKLLGLGVLVSVAGQLGDLMLSSIKRDIGVKDMGVTLPGHGGILDRFDSLIIAAPLYFHYVGYFLGFGLDGQARIITGG